MEGISGFFSRPGDSGSLVVNEYREIVGLVFAGSKTANVTYANVFENVISKLSSVI